MGNIISDLGSNATLVRHDSVTVGDFIVAASDTEIRSGVVEQVFVIAHDSGGFSNALLLSVSSGVNLRTGQVETAPGRHATIQTIVVLGQHDVYLVEPVVDEFTPTWMQRLSGARPHRFAVAPTLRDVLGVWFVDVSAYEIDDYDIIVREGMTSLYPYGAPTMMRS